MSLYFDTFPTIAYQGRDLRNIMLSARIPQGILAAVKQFAPYTVREAERPTTVAFNYYGDIQWIWLIALANNIVDFYTQWPKSQQEVLAYLAETYGSVATAQSTIDHYTLPTDSSYPKVTPVSYTYLSPNVQAKLQAVTAYDQAFADNDARRNIRLVPAAYAPRLQLELESALNS